MAHSLWRKGRWISGKDNDNKGEGLENLERPFQEVRGKEWVKKEAKGSSKGVAVTPSDLRAERLPECFSLPML